MYAALQNAFFFTISVGHLWYYWYPWFLRESLVKECNFLTAQHQEQIPTKFGNLVHCGVGNTPVHFVMAANFLTFVTFG